LKLGFTAFGGPAAHLALMEEEVVTRRRWLDRQHFLDMVSAVNFIPGPNSTELAIHIGYVRAGWKGLIVAGACFIVPAMMIVMPLAWLYVTYGSRPGADDALRGIKACMVAIIVVALVRFARTGLKDAFTIVVGVLALAASVILQYFRVPQSELIVLAAGALAGVLWYRRANSTGIAGESNRASRSTESDGTARSTAKSIPLLALPLAAGAAAGFGANLLTMALFFLKVGATLFGSGYVLASFLHGGLVQEHGWLTEKQLLDAIAVGQVTPGPLLTTATFIGFLLGSQKFGGGTGGGIVAGVVATVAIFLPSFIFVGLLGPLLPRLRANPKVRGALDGMNAAVVALIFMVTVWFAGSALRPSAKLDVLSIAIFAVSLAMMLTTKINATWLILASGAVGLAAKWVA
jgi:chromate transporter